MTVRELMQKILSEAPDLDAEVYFDKPGGLSSMDEFELVEIRNYGSNDGLFFVFKSII